MNKSKSMDELAIEKKDELVPVRQGDVVEVKILQISKARILVNVANLYLGIIPEKEYSPDITDTKPGDKVLAQIINLENDEGMAILSLRRAGRERLWKNLASRFESGEPTQIKVSDANRGGLIINYGDIEGFLPAGQLASSHYPKIAATESKETILGKLKELVGQILTVKIISFDQKANKLIFSEKAAGDIDLEKKISKFKVGQEISGTVTGIADFGIFVSLGEGIEGLVHISEVSWERVANLKKLYSVGDKVKVQIINLEDGRVSLSMKRLQNNPWIKILKKYKIGQIISGKVTKIAPFGAFVSIDDNLDGLVHISELGSKIDRPEDAVEVGKKYSFSIKAIDEKSHKISLALKKETAEKAIKKAVKKTGKKSKEKARKKINPKK